MRTERRAPRLVAWVVGALVLGSPAWACDSSSCALLTRGQTGLLVKGAWRVDFSFRYTDQGLGLEGSQTTDDVRVPKLDLELGRLRPAIHRETGEDARFLQLDLAYGLTNRTTVFASVPILAHRTFDVSHFGLADQYRTSGWGDATAGLRQSLGPVVAGLYVKLPTGPYRIAGDFDGSILDPTMQPGTGSFDLGLSAQYGAHVDWLALDWTVAGSYQVNTTNAFEYRFGNQAIAAIGAARRLVGPLTASLQAKLAHQDRSEFLGQAVPSTGNTMVYANLGLSLAMRGNVSLYGFWQIPVYRYVNEAQLAPRRALLTGIAKTF